MSKLSAFQYFFLYPKLSFNKKQALEAGGCDTGTGRGDRDKGDIGDTRGGQGVAGEAGLTGSTVLRHDQAKNG